MSHPQAKCSKLESDGQFIGRKGEIRKSGDPNLKNALKSLKSELTLVQAILALTNFLACQQTPAARHLGLARKRGN